MVSDEVESRVLGNGFARFGGRARVLRVCKRNHLPYPVFKKAREPDVITGFAGFFMPASRLI